MQNGLVLGHIVIVVGPGEVVGVLVVAFSELRLVSDYLDFVPQLLYQDRNSVCVIKALVLFNDALQ